MSIIEDDLKMQTKFGMNKEKLTKDQLSFRMDLLNEEFYETNDAFESNRPEEFVDGLIDIIVIAVGTLSLSGVDVQKAWDEVHRANMAKERGVKKGREQSGGFDLIKPEGWVGPSHKDNLGDLDEILAP